MRTVFLCDYHTNPQFQREILTLLNRGESVHTLQRAFSPGRVHHTRGRTKEELAAIASAHTLLTNLIIAFNTMRLDVEIKALRSRGQQIEEETVRHVLPGRYGYINFRGVIRFDTAPYADHLIQRAKRQLKSEAAGV